MEDESLASVGVTRRGHVAVVELRGPGKGNAMGPDLWRELPGVFRALDADPEVRAVVLHGSGGHFSYGLDLPGMMGELGPLLAGEQLAGARMRLLALIERLQGAFDAVERCRKPVIASVSGWCIGGGVDLIAACDVRVCSSDAKFSVREVKLAMVADLGSLQRLPRIVGEGHARQLALTGEDIDAERAARIGLVNDVYPDAAASLEAALALAEQIAANSPLAVQGIKRVMGFTADPPTAAGLAYVAAWNTAFLQSRDLAEAMAAFFERREPRFTGE